MPQRKPDVTEYDAAAVASSATAASSAAPATVAPPPPPAATLREIARQARVHHSTASFILNGARGSTRVSLETRSRVLHVARDLGYSVNRAAQQLKTRRSHVIGLLTGGLENPFFAHMVSLCSKALENEGYEVVLATRRRDETGDLHLLDALVSRQLDGLLLWSETDTEVRERLLRPDMPNTVVMGLETPGHDSVVVRLDEGVRAAMDHLIETRGITRIAYYAPRFALHRSGDPRHETYEEVMAERGLTPQVFSYDAAAAYDLEAARVRAEALAGEMAALPAGRRPGALLCFNDLAAIGAMMGLRRKGWRIPDDIALVGCDDLPLSAQLDVPLTTISYPAAQVCDAAVRLLLDRIRPAPDASGRDAAGSGGGVYLPPRNVLFPAPLIVRASCGSDAAAPIAALAFPVVSRKENVS